jgi:NAD(P)-dependent dehydrogenase (short-subunit alcohol dehydrogenase family)
MDLQLEGKAVLVTCATAGIGTSIARRLAEEGADVSICGREKLKLGSVAEAIGVRGILTDVTAEDGARKLYQALPNVDILINNLGICETKAFESIEDDDWLRLFNVNVLSGARLARFYFSQMKHRGWGRIVFISSDAGVLVPPDKIHYGMTQTAQLSISRGLASASIGTGVTVNSVVACTSSADETERLAPSVAGHSTEHKEDGGQMHFFRDFGKLPIQSFVDSDDVASLVAYLASPLSLAVNGAALRAHGGEVPTIF